MRKGKKLAHLALIERIEAEIVRFNMVKRGAVGDALGGILAKGILPLFEVLEEIIIPDDDTAFVLRELDRLETLTEGSTFMNYFPESPFRKAYEVIRI